MMYQTQSRVNGVVHPLVAGMYVKKRSGAPLSQMGQGSVLVIETLFPVGGNGSQNFSENLSALLSDLPHLRAQAEASIGPFDRVDIHSAH